MCPCWRQECRITPYINPLLYQPTHIKTVPSLSFPLLSWYLLTNTCMSFSHELTCNLVHFINLFLTSYALLTAHTHHAAPQSCTDFWFESRLIQSLVGVGFMIPFPVRATADDYFSYRLICRLYLISFDLTVKWKEIVDLFFFCPTNSPKAPHLKRNAGKSSCVRSRTQPVFDMFAWRMAEMINRLSNFLPISFPISSNLQLYFMYDSFIEVAEMRIWFSDEYLPGNPWQYFYQSSIISFIGHPFAALEKKNWNFLELFSKSFFFFLVQTMMLATQDYMFCYSTWTTRRSLKPSFRYCSLIQQSYIPPSWRF